MSRKIVIPKQLLIDLYQDQGKSIPELAKIMNVGRTTIHKWLIRYGIERKSASEVKRTEGWTGFCLGCGKPSGGRTSCKACSDKKDYRLHKEQRLVACKEYRAKPEVRQRKKHYDKQYAMGHKEQIRKYKNRYSRTSKYCKLANRLRTRLRIAFKNYSKYGKVRSSRKYGINYQKIIEYLGPCPGEYKDYHIDHILPLSIFDLDNAEHVRLACCPENHQWLTAEENFSKKDKVPNKDFLNSKLLAILEYVS